MLATARCVTGGACGSPRVCAAATPPAACSRQSTEPLVRVVLDLVPDSDKEGEKGGKVVFKVGRRQSLRRTRSESLLPHMPFLPADRLLRVAPAPGWVARCFVLHSGAPPMLHEPAGLRVEGRLRVCPSPVVQGLRLLGRGVG